MGVVGFLNMAGRSEAVVPGPVWGGVNGLAARPMLLGWNWVKWRRGRAVNEGPMKTLEAGVTRLQPWIASTPSTPVNIWLSIYFKPFPSRFKKVFWRLEIEFSQGRV